MHFAEDVFQGSGVAQLENPGLLKPELPEYFLSCASSWNYPVYVPDVLVGVVVVRERRFPLMTSVPLPRVQKSICGELWPSGRTT